MAERKQNKEIHFYVTDEERKLIRRKMIESKTKNMGAYLIAKKVNTTGDLYPEEMKELKEMVKEIWHILRSSPLK